MTTYLPDALASASASTADAVAPSVRRSPAMRRIARGLGIVVVLEVLAVPIRLLLQVVLARLCGPESYGMYTVALTWAQLVAIPAGLGLSSVVLRYVPLYVVREQSRQLAGLLSQSRLITLGAGAFLGGIGVTWVVLTASDTAASLPLLLGFLAVPAFALCTLQSETLRAGGKVVAARVIPTVFQPLLAVAAACGVALTTDGLTAVEAIACALAVACICVVVQEFALRRSFAAAYRCGRRRVADTAQWLKVGGQLLVIKLFQMVLNLSDILIVGVLLGATSAGLYAVATKLAAFAGLVPQAVNLALPPAIARAYAEGDNKEIQRQLRWSGRVGFLPSLVTVGVIVALAQPILTVFGDAFIHATGALCILAVGRLVTAWTGPVGTTLSVTGHQMVNLRVYGFAAALQLLLDLWLIPSHGIVGAALANAAAMIFWNLALFAMVMRRLDVRLWPLPERALT